MATFEKILARRSPCGSGQLCHSVLVKIPLTVHPAIKPSNRIVINYPGYLADKDGFNYRYVGLAEVLQKQASAAIVRMGNQSVQEVDYLQSSCDDLKTVIEYTLTEAMQICGCPAPELCLVGFKEGAEAIAAVCHEYPAVRQVVLVTPRLGMIENAGLFAFTGDVHIVTGNDEENIAAILKTTKMIRNAATQCLNIVPDLPDILSQSGGEGLSTFPLFALSGAKSREVMISSPAS